MASPSSAWPHGRRLLAAAYAAHPERFPRGLPTPGTPPPAVWINKPVGCGCEEQNELVGRSRSVELEAPRVQGYPRFKGDRVRRGEDTNSDGSLISNRKCLTYVDRFRYDNKLMLWNPNELPPDWTIAKLKAKHPSRPFNPDVANAFFRAGMIEAWGRGTERILEACRDAGVPEPELRHEPDGLWVEFPFPRQPAGLYSGERWGEKWGEKWGAPVLAKRRKIAEAILQDRRVTIHQLATILSMGTTAIENHLKAMRQQGCIRRVGPAKGGHWEVLT